MITPDECLRRYKDHDMVEQPGGVRQTNPFTNKPSTLKIKRCSRCDTSQMYFEDDPDEEGENGGSGDSGGFTCPHCHKTGGHEEWCQDYIG